MNAMTKLSVQRTFLITRAIMVLMLAFLVVEGVVLWRVCREGTDEVRALDTEGLPSLRHLAALQENLALYQLRSYELMFVQEQDRSAKIAQAENLQQQNLGLIAELRKIFPSGDGLQQVSSLEASLKEYVQTVGALRQRLDKDFQGAMQMLDKEVPGKVKRLDEAARHFKTYCEQFASARTQQSVGAFKRIQESTMLFGCIGAGFGLLATLLVSVSSTRIRRALVEVVNRLSETSQQVGHSSEFVASTSQSLASGATEQAASLEETSSSLEEMASMTQRNAESAEKANALARQARSAADTGASNMQTMHSSMEAIKASSDDIAKIIKTIDEIAFQTNILALNAAVEAARAGEAGMGFAVVAEEVRSLAQRCAQSARETASKIEGAITKTAQGVEISAKVTHGLQEILTKVRQVDELVAEVSTASQEQSQGIAQLNQAVGQMERVTQQNASGAEESASASQELSGQAHLLKEAVSDLLVIINGATLNHSEVSTPQASLAPGKQAARKPEIAQARTPVSAPKPPVKAPAAKAKPTPRQNDLSPITEGDFKSF